MLDRDRTLVIAILCAMLAVCSPALAQKPARFAALLSNGERIEGNSFSDWHNNGSKPKIDGRQLLEDGKELRWQRDRALLPGEAPRAFVETHTGDRFPGVVVDFVPAGASPFDALPPHFLVQPDIELRPSSKVVEQKIRVVSSFVRRIVWQKRERNDFEPNTVFYRDGRAVAFRAARFASGFVNLLLPDGNQRVAFGEIAEIHLAAVDPWQAYFDELAAMDPDDATTRLMQLETSDGLILTGDYSRKQFHPFGNPQESDRWVHALQPAWSLDVIHVPTTNVWARRMWLAHEVPLTRIGASKVVTHSPLSAAGRAPRINANVEGGPLRSANLDFGWGFGVHANTEMTFPLPVGVKALRGAVALDRIAGKGGCVRARVFANDTKSPALWESQYLVGSETVADLGTIALGGPAQNQKSLVLQMDAAHAGRPAGADPLDVRDSADWLDPWLELDRDVVQAEIRKRGLKQFAAWQDWDVSQATGGELEWNSYLNELLGQAPGNYRLAIVPRKQPLVLKRELKLGPKDHWLVVFVNRQVSSGATPKLEVRIGGEPVAEYECHYRQRGDEDQPPLAISLRNYQAAKKPIEVEIRQLAAPESGQGFLDWRAISVVEQLPNLYQAFEDSGVFTAIDAQQQGGAKLVSDDRHYGSHAVQVTPTGQFRLTFDKPLAIREQPKWGEYRHIRFAVRKVGEGRMALEVNRDGGDLRPVRMDGGAGEPVGKSATRVWGSALPNQWIVITRDLYAEFGSFDATGITLQAPDGKHATFDHIYFARRDEDFKQIPNAPPPELTNQTARRDLAKPILDRAYPAIVMIQAKDGRTGAGVIVNGNGEVLTAGHIVASPNEDCVVHLADGRALKAKTRGIWRENDLGMVKIEEGNNFPQLEVNAGQDIPINQLYVAFAHARTIEKSAKPTANLPNIRRVFRGMIWTDFEQADWVAGAPLLDREGRVIGVLTKRSEFGGFLFGRTEGIDGKLNALRGGEVFGAWYPGLGPMFGLSVQSTREGAKVLEVFPNSPAASANLKAGDVVTKVDGRSVVSLEDIYSVLAEKNPGQECTLDYFRAGQMLQAKLLLVPRTP